MHCFLDRYAPSENIQVTPAAMKSFLQYDWPGNVRELENCIARAVALGDHQMIDVGDLPPAIRGAQDSALDARGCCAFHHGARRSGAHDHSCASLNKPAATKHSQEECSASAAQLCTGNSSDTTFLFVLHNKQLVEALHE